jgi:two-component system, NarL family, invasion response regulator UvrY
MSEESGKKRVLIADYHPIIRAGLKQIIDEADDISVADVCDNCRATLENIRNRDYDAVVLDITMPDGSGLDVLKQIKSLRPELPVLILSMPPENQYAMRTLKAGASGYLSKKSAESELLHAIRTICQGRKYIQSSLADQFVAELADGNGTLPHEKLSDREYQVIFLIAHGKTTKEIALQLSLNTKTIGVHRSRAFQKMAMTTDAEIVRYFIENGLY